MNRLRRFVLAMSMLLCAGLALADVPGNREDFQINARTVLAILGMSLLGGVVSFISKVRAGLIPAWSLMQLVGELCTSAFAGFLCYLLCDSAGMSTKLTICSVGIAGHMGTRAITAFESFATKRWGPFSAALEPTTGPGPGQPPKQP